MARRTDTQFKAELERRCSGYMEKQVKRRKYILTAALPLLACIVLVCAVVPNCGGKEQALENASESEMTDGIGADTTNETDAIDVTNEVLVSSMAFSSENYDSLCTDSEDIQAILNRLNSLEMSGRDYDDESRQGYDLRHNDGSYTITVTYQDGTVVTYTIKENRYIQVNGGEWLTVNSEQAAELENLLLKLAQE